MASPFMTSKTPSVDSSLGLVFRLNNLWVRADEAHLNGNVDHWNFVLDAIYDNLSYGSELKLIKDEKGNIKEIKFEADHEKIFNFLSSKIAEYKADKQLALKQRNKKKYIIAKNKLFFAVRDKDKYLRTFMFKLNLYLKQFESHMGNAMFGGS